MLFNSMNAISPIDGRYGQKVEALRPIFSEYGLNYHRLKIEIYWLQCLASQPQIKEIHELSSQSKEFLENLINQFSDQDAQRIKDIEGQTNHDVKAVEYFLKEKVAENNELKKISEFIHFACTSEDINNLAYALMLKEAREKVLLPSMEHIINALRQLAHLYADYPMLARTHGQAASPTTMGKEMGVFVARLKREYQIFKNTPILGKINGAVGNYNAHLFTYPEINWLQLSEEFVKSLGLTWNAYTTQIEAHDFIAAFAHALIRFNSILIDLSRDIWAYIAFDYFKQKAVEKEVGSSTMPHKINPIDFENAEGNLSLANNLLEFLASRLTISRWQRDLVDSTLMRNIGVGLAHSLIAYHALLKGLSKIQLNEQKLKVDLQEHWEVITEAVQTIMRRYGIENPYEKLKSFSRGKVLDKKMLNDFIESLDLPKEAKDQLFNLKPETYIGLAAKLAKEV